MCCKHKKDGGIRQYTEIPQRQMQTVYCSCQMVSNSVKSENLLQKRQRVDAYLHSVLPTRPIFGQCQEIALGQISVWIHGCLKHKELQDLSTT